ncbi:Kelch motif protein [Flavobacterium sp. 90]|uniref:Kelch repeat-containing protein n=1 Tax=unclassified Flavobacterium TaxID=196869 RepID=UPI000EABD92C|nr:MULTISPECIES: carboxypeptidase-like regulatory domain-containing protein [unclassified Flavobacterium]RKR09122.1 Kelch motif protein [Flavobacterium sp. 81]TCK52905.1 Kelch motif protein [Flavobacterium sp. 90]
MKKLLLIIFFLPLITIAQNIKGIIFSQKTDLPIEDTNVFALSSNTGTLSNVKGEFALKLDTKFKDSDTLQFSHIGFITTKISITDLKKLDFKVSLPEDVENLSGVTISANQKLTLKSKLSFKKLSALKNPVFAFGSFLKDEKIYVIGGDASFDSDAFKKVRLEKPDFSLKDYLDEIKYNTTLFYYKGDFSTYNIKTDSWEVSNLKFKKRAFHNIHFYNNSIYVLGGKRISVNGKFEYLQDQIEVLDLDKQTIKTDNTNPHQAANFASFLYKDNIIVMGGSVKMSEKGKKDFSNKMHLYNLTSGYWYELDNMSTAKEATGILIDDKIYLIGGNNGNPISQIESFDLISQKWQIEGELFSGLERPAITYHDNIIYIFENQKMLVYDLKTKQLKEYIVELGLQLSAMYYDTNKLYILGGRTENEYSTIPSANVFSIDTEEFKTTQPNRIKVLSGGSILPKAD